MQELTVIVKQKNGTITFNAEQIKEQLSKELKIYKNLVFTEESKKEAKKSVAELRKLKKSIAESRIAVKEEQMKPYLEFEAQVKELDKLIDEPIQYINEQIEEFEKKRVLEKQETIRKIYAESIEDMGDFLPLKNIYDKKWENATVSQKSIKEAVMARAEAVKKDLETIQVMKSDAVPKAVELYKNTLSLADAITYINKYESDREEILKREEEKKAAVLEQQKSTAAPAQPEPTQPEPTQPELTQPELTQPEPTAQPTIPEQPSIPPLDPVAAPRAESGWITYQLKADRFQIVKLEAMMREYGMEYRRV